MSLPEGHTPPTPYAYNADTDRVIDGDTVDLRVRLGFDISQKIRVRLRGLNAPEVHGEERASGQLATAALQGLLYLDGQPRALVVETTRDTKEKYGRYLATIWAAQADGTWVNVNAALIDGGFAVPYDGGRR